MKKSGSNSTKSGSKTQLREDSFLKILELVRSNRRDDLNLAFVLLDQLKPNMWEKMQLNYTLRRISDWLPNDTLFEKVVPNPKRGYLWDDRTWDKMIHLIEKDLYEKCDELWYHLVIPF